MTVRRRALATGCIVAAGLAATACGSAGIDIASNSKPDVKAGANLFAERCAGCHTFYAAGTQGGATRVHDRERTDGPNFNVRPETVDSVLYAIRNGGFSGAIMPQNIVVGNQANDIAAFVSRYAGRKRPKTISTPTPPPAQTTRTPPSQGSTGQQTTPVAGTTSTGGGATSTGGGTTSTGGGTTQQASAQGKQIFTQNCGSCHTLKDAKTTGQVGPNLDQLKPDQPTVQRQVTNGGGGMPAFKGQLSPAQIQAVAQYVSSVAGK